MRIGELSRRTGVSARSLRYYEQQGLLTACRDASGYRRYGADAVETVGRIRELLAAGLNTADIGEVLPCAHGGPGLMSCDVTLRVLGDQLARIDAEMAELGRRREALVGVCEATAARRREDEALARFALRA
ncbi:MerR family transcriptional regulator [Streptomyces sp. NPDC001404]|uniref:MerR family transcriptional regulator n=1 Tax=Streptomyces sp. NPDC001404 TaxID=3364571 RepID=UPI003693FC61